MDDILDDIEKLRNTLRVDKIAILGHSMFGLLPLEYTVKYPENISCAISIGSIPFKIETFYQAKKDYWEKEASAERKQLLERNRETLHEIDMEELSPTQQFIEIYTAETPYRFCDPNFDMKDYWEGADINMNFLYHYNGKLMKDIDHTDNYRNIKCTVLVFSGKYDFGAPYYLCEDIKDRYIIPNLKLIVYENAGHNPFLEIPEVFAKDFLESVTSIN